MIWIVEYPTDPHNAQSPRLMRAFKSHQKALNAIVRWGRTVPGYNYEDASERAQRNGESEYVCAQYRVKVFDLKLEG